MPDPTELAARDRETMSLVTRLRVDGDVTALIALLQDGDEGPERVRDALTVLAELDPELIVQVALDALLLSHVRADGTALQPRRVVREDGR